MKRKLSLMLSILILILSMPLQVIAEEIILSENIYKVRILKIDTDYLKGSYPSDEVSGIKYNGSDGREYISDAQGLIKLENLTDEGLILTYAGSEDGKIYFHENEVIVKKEDFLNYNGFIEKQIYIAEEKLIKINAVNSDGNEINYFTVQAREDGIPIQPEPESWQSNLYTIKAKPGKIYEVFGDDLGIYVTSIYEFNLSDVVDKMPEDLFNKDKSFMDTLTLNYKKPKGNSKVTLNVIDALTQKPLITDKKIEYELSLKDYGNQNVLRATMDENGQIVFENVPRNLKGQFYVLSPTYETIQNDLSYNSIEFKIQEDDSNLEFTVYVSREKKVKIQLVDDNWNNIKKSGVNISIASSDDTESYLVSTDENGQVYFTAK